MKTSIWTSGSKSGSVRKLRVEIVRRIVFRKKASAELRAIADFTEERWGKQQASDYVADLRARIASLGEFPMRFPEFGPDRPGLRKMRCGSHVVFYVIADKAVVIARILHESQDFKARLR